MSRIIYPLLKAFNTDGQPLSGGLAYTYGLGGTAHKTTYSNPERTIANKNPVVLNPAGEARIFLAAKDECKIVCKNSAGDTIWTAENVITAQECPPTADKTTFQAFYPAGAALAGGKVYTYKAGTTTPETTYSDAALLVENANPVILDSAGEAAIFRAKGFEDFKLILKNAQNELVWTWEDFPQAGLALPPVQSLVLRTIAPERTGPEYIIASASLQSMALRQIAHDNAGLNCWTDPMAGSAGEDPEKFVVIKNDGAAGGLDGNGAFEYDGYDVGSHAQWGSWYRYENTLNNTAGVTFDMEIQWRITDWALAASGEQRFPYLAVNTSPTNPGPLQGKMVYWNINKKLLLSPTRYYLMYQYAKGSSGTVNGPYLNASGAGEGLTLGGSLRFTLERLANGSVDIALMYKQTGYHSSWQVHHSYNAVPGVLWPLYVHWGMDCGTGGANKGISGYIDSIIIEATNVDCPGT